MRPRLLHRGDIGPFRRAHPNQRASMRPRLLHRGDHASCRAVRADQGAALTRALAADHSPEGIRGNAVGPGPIFTPFHQRRIAASGETVEQYNARASQGTMLKRPGRAEEVARRDPVFGLRRCLLRHRHSAVRGRRYDGAVRMIQSARSQSNLSVACPHQQWPDSIPSSLVGCRTTECTPEPTFGRQSLGTFPAETLGALSRVRSRGCDCPGPDL